MSPIYLGIAIIFSLLLISIIIYGIKQKRELYKYKMRVLTTRLLITMKMHGPRSKEVIKLVRENKKVPNFPEVAATFIFVAVIEEKKRNGEKIDSEFVK